MAFSMQSALSGPEKLAAVSKLVNVLQQDLTDSNLSPQSRDAALEELKIYGRDPRNADPIFTKEGIETLTRHSFDSTSSTTSRNALRCLCNALLLKPDARQRFVDLGYEAKACSKLKNDNRDDEFLVSRVLFLTTYGTNANLHELIDSHDLGNTIARNLERHAERKATSRQSTDPMEQMALIETLKLLFNITHHCKDKVSPFTHAIPHIVTLLRDSTLQLAKPLDPPVGSLINALLNLELGAETSRSSFYPESKPTGFSDRLLDLLNRSTEVYTGEELEATVTPLVGVIRAVHEYAPEQVKTSIREKLLPTEADRDEVLGKTKSVPSWLLKNSTNPLTPHLREIISDLLFELSDKDATKFISNVGYGFASGYLFSKNIPVPETATDIPHGASGDTGRPINPITGQYSDRERHPDVPEMTEEEQEREAERLFVLFERLRANGVISVENPVRTAVEEGRFEELPDDYQDDVD